MTRSKSKPVVAALVLFSIFLVVMSFLPQPNVNAAPSIALSLVDGPKGTTVGVTGSGFSASGTCTISSSVAGVIGSQSCTVTSGTITSANFVVSGSAPVGPTTITVAGPAFDTASTGFTVDTAPVDTPSTAVGAPGTTVTLTTSSGSYSTGDTSCIITSSPTGIIANPFCTISGGKIDTSQFTVAGSAAGGFYTVSVTAFPGGDLASFLFQVTTVATITLSPLDGPVGTHVSLTGSSFGTADAGTCTFSAAPATLVFSSPSCSISYSGTVSGGFTVGPGSTAAGYTVTVHGNVHTATSPFTVRTTPVLELKPNFGTAGTSVEVGNSAQFSSSDTSCSLSSPTGGVIASQACVISGGLVNGTKFIVGTVPAGAYVITVTGSPGGDSASAVLTVGPTITLSPTSGGAGSVVTVTGFGFSSLATNCSLSDPFAKMTDNPNNPRFANATCGVLGSSGQIAGSFVVRLTAPPGTYVINATDTVGNSAGAAFTIGAPTAQIIVTPNIAMPGTSVSVSGSGFLVSDNSCKILSISGVIASSTCNISGGNVAASVTLSPTAPAGLYLIIVNATPAGDFASNYLEVPIMTITVTSTTSTLTVATSSSTGSTSVTSTFTQTSQSTTTITYTGISTETDTEVSWFTVTGQFTQTLTTLSTSTTYISYLQTSTVLTTRTETTGVGGMIQPAYSVNENILAFVAGLLLLPGILLRRLVS